jgi:hypothetical protein
MPSLRRSGPPSSCSAGIKPEPTKPVELKVPGEDFTRTVNNGAGTELSADQLFTLLSGNRRRGSAYHSRTASERNTHQDRR